MQGAVRPSHSRLVVGEIGGFAVLFAGFVAGQLF